MKTNSVLPNLLRSVMFSAISALLVSYAAAVPVTFQVDLSIQESIGRFDPAMSTVEVRGSFNAWEGGDVMENTDPSEGVYVHEIEVPDPAGSTIPYKFVIVDGDGVVIWESDVGDGQTNRIFILSGEAQELPVVFFDNLATDPGGGVDVTFQVDMAARIQGETFDPGSDFVEVRGPFNNWSAGDRLSPAEDGSTVYEGSVTVKFILSGSQVPYKYIINDAEWETGENRLFELGESARTVPKRFFNDIEPVDLGPLGTLAITAAIDGSFALRWDNPNATLEGTTDLSADAWDAVAGPGGATEISLSTDLARTLFFRIAFR